MSFQPKLVELLLVVLSGVSSIVRHEYDTLILRDRYSSRLDVRDVSSIHELKLTLLPQELQDFKDSWNNARSLPYHAVTIEKPSIIVIQQFLIVLKSRKPCSRRCGRCGRHSHRSGRVSRGAYLGVLLRFRMRILRNNLMADILSDYEELNQSLAEI